MKVYVSGPIKGHEDTYRDDFANAALYVAGLWHLDSGDVVSPVVMGDRLAETLHREPSYQEHMKNDIGWLLECDLIHMMPGWEHSAGARCEHLVAVMCGLGIGYQ